MKPLILIFSGILIVANTCFNVNGDRKDGRQNQKSHKIGEAFLLGFEKVKLYDKIKGREVSEIQNNLKEEVYYSFEIYAQKGNWFKVKAVAMEDTISGWILNKSYLATYSKSYESNTLFVYDETDKKEVICSISYPFNSPMQITEFKKDWVKVEIKEDSLVCKGWILQNMTCSSPYTTCP